MELIDWNVGFFVPSILKEAKHNASKGYRELKRLTEGISVFNMHKTTINTINAIFTCLLWFTFIVIAFKDLKTIVPDTAQTHEDYLRRLGTAHVFGLQWPKAYAVSGNKSRP